MPRLSTSTVVPSVALLAVLTTGADPAPTAPVASLPDDEPQPDTTATVATANATRPHGVRVMLFIASPSGVVVRLYGLRRPERPDCAVGLNPHPSRDRRREPPVSAAGRDNGIRRPLAVTLSRSRRAARARSATPPAAPARSGAAGRSGVAARTPRA